MVAVVVLADVERVLEAVGTDAAVSVAGCQSFVTNVSEILLLSSCYYFNIIGSVNLETCSDCENSAKK